MFTFLKNKLKQLVLGHDLLDDKFFEELEMALIQADVGVVTSSLIISKLKDSVEKNKICQNEAALTELKKIIVDLIFEEGKIAPLALDSKNHPKIILVLGVNGSGKTTFIAKLAHYLKRRKGLSGGTQARQMGGQVSDTILLAAADTFRPAAIEQLKKWAERLRLEVIAHQLGSDPAAVVFDAIGAARSRNKEILLIDTAGRLHTKEPLMDELKKIIRIIKKEIPNGPDEILLTIDSTTGQNGLTQAKVFHQNLGLTGIVLTKTDGTAKGGIVLAIKNELKIPVKFISSGETLEDLSEFSPPEFVEDLIG